MLRLGSAVWVSLSLAILASRIVAGAAGRDILAFVSDRNDNSEIYVMDIGTRLSINVSRDTVNDTDPAWLSDGKLAFASRRAGNFDIYSGTLANVSNSRTQEYDPTWANNGQLAFVSSGEGNPEIYALDLNSGMITNLTNNFGKLIRTTCFWIILAQKHR